MTINSFDDIPSQNEINISEILQEKSITNLYDAIKEVIKEVKVDTSKHKYIAAILAVSTYAVMTEGYVSDKKKVKYNIKFKKVKKYTFNFKSETTAEKTIYSDDFSEHIGYNITGLPDLAVLLAMGNNLSNELVNSRLELMKVNDVTFRYKTRTEVQIGYSGQIKSLIEDLTINWTNVYKNEWQKLGRNFLLGLLMYGYYENDLSKMKTKNKKSKNNKNDKDKIRNQTLEDTINDSFNRLSKSIMKDESTSAIFDGEVTQLVGSNKETLNYEILSKNINNEIKKNLRFSYYLFYFVRFFGFVALVSPAMAGHSGDFKLLSSKNLNDMYDILEDLKTNKLGKDFINQNSKYADNICDVIIKCAQNMKISNENLENSLNLLIQNYKLNDVINNENLYEDDEDDEEMFEELENSSEPLLDINKNIQALKSIVNDNKNGKKGDIRRRRPKHSEDGHQRRSQRVKARRIRGANLNYGINKFKWQNLGTNSNSKLDTSSKNQMNESINMLLALLNDDAKTKLYNDAYKNEKNYRNLDPEDAKLTSIYDQCGSLINKYEIPILSDKDRTELKRHEAEFLNNIDVSMIDTYNETYNKQYHDMLAKNEGFKLLTKEEQELFVKQAAINECYNNENMWIDNDNT